MTPRLALAVLATLTLASSPALAWTNTSSPPSHEGAASDATAAPSPLRAQPASYGDRQDFTDQPDHFTGLDWGDASAHLHLGGFQRVENTEAPHPDFDPHAHSGVGVAMSFKLGS